MICSDGNTRQCPTGSVFQIMLICSSRVCVCSMRTSNSPPAPRPLCGVIAQWVVGRRDEAKYPPCMPSDPCRRHRCRRRVLNALRDPFRRGPSRQRESRVVGRSRAEASSGTTRASPAVPTEVLLDQRPDSKDTPARPAMQGWRVGERSLGHRALQSLISSPRVCPRQKRQQPRHSIVSAMTK